MADLRPRSVGGTPASHRSGNAGRSGKLRCHTFVSLYSSSAISTIMKTFFKMEMIMTIMKKIIMIM